MSRRTGMVARASGQTTRAGRSVASHGKTPVAAVVEEARRAGFLDGDRAEHLSFRAPAALVEAAKRETGITSTTELGIAALAMLAQPDPVVVFLRRTRGKLTGLPPIEP